MSDLQEPSGGPARRAHTRRIFIYLGLVVIVAALFYWEENWRGQAVWEECKRQFAARGLLLDWDVYIPAPVRSSRNFFQAPRMQKWFQGRGTNDLSERIRDAWPEPAPVTVCEVTVVPPDTASTDLAAGANVVLRYLSPGAALFPPDDPSAGASALDVISFDNVPMGDAMLALALQARLKITFDPATSLTLSSNKIIPLPGAKPLPSISAQWRHVSALQGFLALLNFAGLQMTNDPAAQLARITVKEPDAPACYAPAETRAAVRALSEAALGARFQAPQGYLTFAAPLDRVIPARLIWRADTIPGTNDIASFFFNLFPGFSRIPIRNFHVGMTASNSFRVDWERCWSAADYLARTDGLEPQFGLIREALRRPLARLTGDYTHVRNCPIQNFVASRYLAQTLATRAQCDLLLGRPDRALPELAFIHDFLRTMEAKPTTLVAAMIHVAISGLYCSIITDGLQRHAWQEPQLSALEEQLGSIRLLPLVAASFPTEAAASCGRLEQSEDDDFATMIKDHSQWWQDPEVVLHLATPRGWTYQNMAVIATLDLGHQTSLDFKNNRVWPRRADRAIQDVNATLAPFSPYTIVARIAVPNYARAIQVTARNQSLLDQTRVACALERYRLAQGQYPDSLAALVPGLIDLVPDDLIGGLPLKFHRTEDGKFRLYSVGWNETDDGGDAKKDWVWGEAL